MANGRDINQQIASMIMGLVQGGGKVAAAGQELATGATGIGSRIGQQAPVRDILSQLSQISPTGVSGGAASQAPVGIQEAQAAQPPVDPIIAEEEEKAKRKVANKMFTQKFEEEAGIAQPTTGGATSAPTAQSSAQPQVLQQLSQALAGAPQAQEAEKEPGIFGDTKGEGISNFLQTLVSVATGVPTPGFIKFARRSQEFKTGLETQKELAKVGATGALALSKELREKQDPKALTPEAGVKFGLLQEGEFETNKLIDSLFKNPAETKGLIIEGKFKPEFFKSQIGKKIIASMRRAHNARLRLESGALISEEEVKAKWKVASPKVSDSVRTAFERILPERDFFSKTLNVIDPTGAHRKRAGNISQSQLSQVEQEAGGIVMEDSNGNRAIVDPKTNKVIKEL